MLRCGSAVGARPFTTAAEHARRSIGQNTRVCAERRQDQGVERGKGVAIKIVVRVGGKKWKRGVERVDMRACGMIVPLRRYHTVRRLPCGTWVVYRTYSVIIALCTQ